MRPAGFTLVEVLIGGAIGTFVLGGVLTSFLLLGQSGARIVNYTTLERDARHTLEVFAEDVRMCQSGGITYNNDQSVTLTVVGNYTGYANQVTYACGSVTIGGVTTPNCFYRRPGNASSTATPEILMRNLNLNNIAENNPATGLPFNPAIKYCHFSRYDGLSNGGTGAAGANDQTTGTTIPADSAIKRVELTLRASITSVTTAIATEHVVSATYVLRN
jgi:hypothetical protein